MMSRRTGRIKKRKTKVQHQRQMKTYWKAGLIILAALLAVLAVIRVARPQWLGGGYIEYDIF